MDNAATYSAHHFGRILGHLGIELIHSRPYRPQGRGKMERFFQVVKTGFTSEVYRLLQEGQALSLEELNHLFSAWVHTYYHERVHSATKQKPRLRFEGDRTPLRQVDLARLYDAFLLEETRTVDKTGVFSLQGQNYQADLALARSKVLVRYDPYQPRQVQVWQGNQRHNDAVSLLSPPEHTPRTPAQDVREEPAPISGLNFVRMTQQEHQQAKPARITYRALLPKGDTSDEPGA